MLKLAEYLQNNGCDVHVLCARTAHFDTFGYDKLLKSLQITYVDDPAAKAASRAFSGGLSPTSGAAGLVQVIKLRIKQVAIDLLTPDTAVTMLGRMRRASCAIVALQPEMTVITSGPPHSVHLVGHWLRERFSTVQWIVDYRDSWNSTSLFRKRYFLFQKLNEYFERRVLSRCDQFTYISSPMLSKVQQFVAEPLAGKSHLIANGFDIALLEQFRNLKPQVGVLRLGYFGSIDDGKDSYRNPACIFDAIASVPNLAIRLEFYGSIQLSPEWKTIFGERLFVGPRLSHREALETMAGMDALLLLHTRAEGADEVVTGKVFEYVASGLPIVSIGPSEMEVNNLLSGDSSFFYAEHTNRDAIAKLLSHLVTCKEKGIMQKREQSKIGSFSRDRQFQVFLNLINEHSSRKS